MTSLIKLVTRALLFHHKVSKFKMIANPALWFLPQNCYSCIIDYFETVSTALTSRSWWRHQMETFSALLAICARNSPVPVNSPHKGQWCGALMYSLICVWMHDWVNNRETGDLRRYRAHYDVILMSKQFLTLVWSLVCDINYVNNEMKGQSEIAYLPKFANMMLIVMVIVITEILYIILIFDCFENQ